MIGMQVKKLNAFSDDVYDFRRTIICSDENASLNYLDQDIKYTADIPEEVWKFSKRKWESLELDYLYGVYVDNKVVALSGAKWYGDKTVLRMGMMYYTLKEYRTILRSPLWKQGGLLSTNVADVQHDFQYSFISIYPHNDKLKKWIKAFARKTGRGQLGLLTDQVAPTLDLFDKYHTDINLSGVKQSIFYAATDTTTMSVAEMIDTIQDPNGT
jgi:hypothetical protein